MSDSVCGSSGNTAPTVEAVLVATVIQQSSGISGSGSSGVNTAAAAITEAAAV